MTVFTVHLPSDGGDRLAEAEQAVFVPEAFSWWAMILGPLWLAANRAWFGLVAWLVIVVGVTFAIDRLQPSSDLPAYVVFAIAMFLGFEGRQLKRISLKHRGYRLADVVADRSRADAERTFFARWLDTPGNELPGAAPPPAGGDVLGLFPEAGRRS
jgi:hypothetical protein